MKKFIFRTLSFLLLLVTTLAGFYSYNYFKNKNEVVKITAKNIVIGDSNTRWSINDSILKNFKNYSTGGEIYLFAYTKLKTLDRNNKIDTLLLGFSPHNIINNMWWDDSKTQPINNRMPGFFSDFDHDEHLFLLENSPKNYLSALMKVGNEKLKRMFSPRKKEDPIFKFGSYMPSKANETQFPVKPYDYEKPKITEQEIIYLKKIIAECKSKNIHLILINPPKNYLRKDYKNYRHQEFYDYYNQNLPTIDFLDFSELPLPKHAYFDMSHVDIVGAEYFSNFLQKNGLKNLLNSKYNLKK